MERLTVDFGGQWVPEGLCTMDRDGNPENCDRCPGSNGNCDGDCDECPVQACFDRLAAYEDTGITPEQVHEMDRIYAEKCREVAGLKMAMAGQEGADQDGKKTPQVHTDAAV